MNKLIKLLLAAVLCMNFSLALAEGTDDPAPYADFKLEKPDNMNVGALGNNGTAGSGKDVIATSSGNTVTFEKVSNNVTTQGNFCMHGQSIKNLTSKLLKDTPYIVEMYVKNAAPEVAETVQFGIMADYSHVGAKQILDISNTEYEKYTVVITPTNRDTSELSFGIPYTFDTIGVKVSVGYGTENTEYPLYVAPETATEIGLERTDTNEVAEDGTELAFKAEILNQVGLPSLVTSPIEWTVVTDDRTDMVTDGFVLTQNNNDATLLVNGATPGKYALVASSTVDGNTLRTGAEFEVLNPSITDNETKTDGERDYRIGMEKIDGETSIGIFDKIKLKASVGDNYGNTDGYDQEFNWYVTDESRRNIVTDSGIVITLSDDTAEATISLENDAVNGNYYIVAESNGLRKTMAFTVDTSSTIADIVENINTQTAEQIAEYIKDYAEILNIDLAAMQKADTAEWSRIVKETVKTAAVADETETAKLLKTAAIVSLYNINEENEPLSDDEYNFIYADELDLANIDVDGVTIYSLYSGENALISAEGKEKVQKSLVGQNFDTVTDLQKAAAKAILLNTIAYTNNLGSGYLSEVLTSANLKYVGITAEKYEKLSDKTKIHGEIAGNVYTIDTLASKLKSVSSTSNKKTSSSSGGGSSSSSGGTGGGSYSTPVVKPTEKAEDKITDTMLKFTDLPSDHWAYSDIYHLTVRGIFSGKDETSFAPDDVLTREEIVKLVCKVFDKTGNATTKFTDVNSNDWYAPYIAAAVENNIVNGISDDTFGIGQPVTRQDICVILVRALGRDVSDESSDITFADANDVAEYAKSAVAYLSSLSALNGFEDGTFRPNDTCTRAQAAKILRCVMDLRGVLTND